MSSEPVPSTCFQSLDLPDGDVRFCREFFPRTDADRLFQELIDTTAWRQENIKLYGKLIPMPRLTAWYGDEGTVYRYSGIVNHPLPWTSPLLEVKRAVEGSAGVAFNSVLVNRYRTGQDSVSWHSDDEKEFGDDQVIASVSLGGRRTFQLRHKTRKELRASVALTHGSLLVMQGATQRNWLHQVPKTTADVGERINLTFRLVKPVADGPPVQEVADL